MGALSPVISGLGAISAVTRGISNVVSGIGGLTSDPYKEQSRILRAQQDLALRQLEQQQAAQTSDAEQKAGLERAKMAADAVAAEDQRRAALRRAVARQRASFGAQGLDAEAADGSGEAVLLGLFGESERERQDRERLDGIREAAIGQDLEDRRRINVLQRQQLLERQKLERVAGRY